MKLSDSVSLGRELTDPTCSPRIHSRRFYPEPSINAKGCRYHLAKGSANDFSTAFPTHFSEYQRIISIRHQIRHQVSESEFTRGARQVLYLAEVKKQTKGFIKGFKTELRLLACQHSDQTWSSVPGDEILSSEAIEQPVGDGVLFLLNLNQSRQIQDKPELAAPELVRQLQKLSRLSEKIKEQREEVESWKQSLTIQFKELSRREMEMESRQEQIESIIGELSQLEQYRQENESIREQIAQDQQKIDQFTNQYRELVNLPAEQLARFQQWLTSQSHDKQSHDRAGLEPDALIVAALTAFSQQQSLFHHYWQEVTEQQSFLEQRLQQLVQQESSLQKSKEIAEIAQKQIEEATIQLEVQKNVLASKQEWLRRLDVTLQANEELQTTFNRLVLGTIDGGRDHQQIIETLEALPLGELEANLNRLKAELDKLIQFVNDQEEELTLQSQAVQDLEAQLAIANEYDRLAIESAIEEERERKGMLDETLVGQRRTLKERQKIFLQYLRVLRRRQGILEPDEHFATLDWDVIVNQIQEVRLNIEEEQHHLEAEIDYLHQSLGQIQALIAQSQSEHQKKRQEIYQEEQNYLQLKMEVQQLQFRIQILREVLQPLQNQSDEILPKLEELQKIFGI